MAFYSIRRSLMSLSSSLLHRNFHHRHLHGVSSSRRISILVSSNPCFPSTNLEAAERQPLGSNSSHLLQWFRFTGSLPAQSQSQSDKKEIYRDIRRGGKMYKFDKNHWEVSVRFEQDEEDISREEMVEIYIAMATKVLGSVEEAKKRIYSYYTSNFAGDNEFCVECSEDTSRKFKELPGVSWVSPDHSYLKTELKKKKRIAETKKRQKQIAEWKKHRILCKKRVICRSIPWTISEEREYIAFLIKLVS